MVLLFVLLAVPTCLMASSQTNDRLRQLDKSLAQRDTYEQNRVKRINELRNGLQQAKAEGRYFEQLQKLYEEMMESEAMREYGLLQLLENEDAGDRV